MKICFFFNLAIFITLLFWMSWKPQAVIQQSIVHDSARGAESLLVRSESESNKLSNGVPLVSFDINEKSDIPLDLLWVTLFPAVETCDIVWPFRGIARRVRYMEDEFWTDPLFHSEVLEEISRTESVLASRELSKLRQQQGTTDSFTLGDFETEMAALKLRIGAMAVKPSQKFWANYLFQGIDGYGTLRLEKQVTEGQECILVQSSEKPQPIGRITTEMDFDETFQNGEVSKLMKLISSSLRSTNVP